MLKQIIEDLMFSHIQSVLWIHVQGEENLVLSYFISVSFLFATTWKHCSYFFVHWFFFSCNTRSQLLEMLLSSYTMKSSPRGVNTLSSSLKNGRRRQWSRLGRTIISNFASTFLCVILPFQIFWRQFIFIMTWTSIQKCSWKSCRC